MPANNFISALLLSLSLLAFPLTAEEVNTNTCTAEDYALVFFNGVLTDRAEARRNVRATIYALDHGNKFNQEKLKYVLAYNESGKLRGVISSVEDFAETFEQRASEYDILLSQRWELFWAILRGEQSSGFFDYLGDVLSGYFSLLQAALAEQRQDMITQILSFSYNNQADIQTSKEHQAILDSLMWRGNKLMLVAHSQGNLYMNKAYDHIKNVKAYASGDAVKALHIAPASPILNGNHILSDVDLVIIGLDLFTGWDINVNFTWPEFIYRPDPAGHNYISMYLNTSSGLKATVVAAINANLLSLNDPEVKDYLVELKLTPQFNLQRYYSASVHLTDYQSTLYSAGYYNSDYSNPPTYQAMKDYGVASNLDLTPTEIGGDPYNGYRIENCGGEEDSLWLKHGSYMLTANFPYDKGQQLNLYGAPQPGMTVEITDRFGETLDLIHNPFPGSTGKTTNTYTSCVGMRLRHVVSLDQDDYTPFKSLLRSEKLQMPSKIKIEELWPLCVPH